METIVGGYIGTTRDPFPHSLLSTRQFLLGLGRLVGWFRVTLRIQVSN